MKMKKEDYLIRESERIFRHLFDISPYALILLDLDGKLIDYNSACSKLFFQNIDEEEIKDKTILEIMKRVLKNPEALVNVHKKRLSTITERFSTKPIEIELERITGEKIWVLVESVLAKLEDTTIIQTIIQDITKRKEAEKRLRGSEEKYRDLFKSSQDAIMTLEPPAWNFFSGNPTALKMFKVKTVEDFCSRAPWQYSPEKQPDGQLSSIKAKEMIDKAMRVGTNFFEWTHKRLDGKLFPATVLLSRMEIGDNLFLQATVRDITKHKLAEQKLKESEEKYKLLSGITSDYIYEWNIETDELEWYGGFDEALGYKKGGIPRTIEAWVSRIHPEDQKKLKNAVEIHRKSINPIYEEYRVQKKDGKWLYWIDHGVPIVRDGKPIKWIGGCKDITGRKKAEQKLIESEEKLRDLNKKLEQKVEERTRKLKKAYNRAEFYKDLFAHDMNNNLQAILSSVDLASLLQKNENYFFKVEELLDKVKMFVGDGARLISDVKKLSKLEKEDQISIQSIEVLAILKNVIEFSQNQNQDKEVNVELETSYEKVIVQANELMHDVFENIMINAIRHNKNSLVEIMIRISKIEKDGMKYYKFNFIDNGMGISDNRKEKIFQRGFMEDKSLRGMGLGLSLIKKIIDSYNGQIWIEDKVQGDHSKGSNFIISIPVGDE